MFTLIILLYFPSFKTCSLHITTSMHKKISCLWNKNNFNKSKVIQRQSFNGGWTQCQTVILPWRRHKFTPCKKSLISSSVILPDYFHLISLSLIQDPYCQMTLMYKSCYQCRAAHRLLALDLIINMSISSSSLINTIAIIKRIVIGVMMGTTQFC